MSKFSILWTLGLVTALGLQAPQAAQAATYSLFDASSNLSPAQQGWAAQIPAGATQTIQSGTLVLNTSSSDSLQAGYARVWPNNLAISLNRTTGYTLSLDLQLPGESHGTKDRAGFNAILISSDKRAIELDFWTTEIWALKDATDGAIFTHGEGVLTNTKTMRHYDVVVKGSQYCLFADGKYSQPALKGRLRDYSRFGFPYSQPNLIFLGDNTKSASAITNLKKVRLSEGAIAACP
jgi:hypothetical protein